MYHKLMDIKNDRLPSSKITIYNKAKFILPTYTDYVSRELDNWPAGSFDLVGVKFILPLLEIM